MKTIYFHIGQTKTATTTLQTMFTDNRDWLKSQGVFYPEVPEDHPVKIQHRFLFDAVAAHPQDLDRAREPWAYLISQIANSPLEKFLVSEELFWHMFPQRPELRRKAIQWIKKIFSDYNVKIICYLRRQDRWLESWYNQIVKVEVGPLTQMSIEDFAQDSANTSLMNYSSVLMEWEQVFGHENMIVRPFESSKFLQGSVFSDFLSLLDIHHVEGLTFPKDQQVSLSNAACEFSRIYNALEHAETHKKLMTRMLLHVSNLHKDKDKTRLLPKHVAKQILDNAEAGNAELATRYGISESLFFSDAKLEPDRTDYPGISINELAEICAQVFIDQQRKSANLRRRVEMLEKRLK